MANFDLLVAVRKRKSLALKYLYFDEQGKYPLLWSTSWRLYDTLVDWLKVG